jgi:hypothetical protein
MQLRPEFEIATMIRAMKDVVIPAVDPDNRLAVEQSQLVLGMLALLARQLPVQFRFDRDELARLAASAQRLERLCAAEPTLAERARALASLATAAGERLARSAVDPSELVSASRDLRAEIGALASEAGDVAGAEPAAAIEREVLELSREQLLRDRAYLAPQGFEPGLPAIEDLLANPSTDERTEPNRR